MRQCPLTHSKYESHVDAGACISLPPHSVPSLFIFDGVAANGEIKLTPQEWINFNECTTLTKNFFIKNHFILIDTHFTT